MLPLNVEFKARASFGKGSAKKIRKEGEVPCVMSSVKFGATSVALSKKIADKMVQSSRFFAEIHNVKVNINGKNEAIKIIPLSVDFHPVNNSILHIDFNHVIGDEVIALVPVKIVGADKAPGLKKGGKLNLVRYHVPLKCKIESIPQNVEVNISTFGVGRSIFLSSVKFEKDVQMAYDCLILSITGRGKKEKAEDEAQAAQAAAPAVATKAQAKTSSK
jgi:large subunit ribosomal protein L25